MTGSGDYRADLSVRDEEDAAVPSAKILVSSARSASCIPRTNRPPVTCGGGAIQSAIVWVRGMSWSWRQRHGTQETGTSLVLAEWLDPSLGRQKSRKWSESGLWAVV